MTKIKLVDNKDEFNTAYHIRVKVFVEEQGVPIDIEKDELDEEAKHVLLYEDNIPVACGRIVFRADTAIMGRIAVIKEKREKGYGKVICENLIHAAMKNRISKIVLHAQVYAINFYRKLGFVENGETFEEAGIEHIEMIKKLV